MDASTEFGLTSGISSDCVRSAIAGPYANCLFDIENEDFAIADSSGAGGILDCFDNIVDKAVFDDDLNFHLGKEIDHIFGAAIELGMAFLASEALDLANRDSRDPDVVKRILHVVELEWLDDRLDLLHAGAPMNPAPTLMPNQRPIWKAGRV
jgi:hypothetical protein